MEEGKIVPTGETDEIGRYRYIDKRIDSERKLRTIETIKLEENKEAQLTTRNITNGESTIKFGFLARIKRILGL